MITVSIKLFAGLHQLIGKREIEMRLPDGATVAVLRDALGTQYPLVQALLPSLVCAIGEEYVESSQILTDGDHVALIPPVSGGTSATRSPSDVASRAKAGTWWHATTEGRTHEAVRSSEGR